MHWSDKGTHLYSTGFQKRPHAVLIMLVLCGGVLWTFWCIFSWQFQWMTACLKADSAFCSFFMLMDLDEIRWIGCSAHFHHLCKITCSRDVWIACKSIFTECLKPPRCVVQLLATLCIEVIVCKAAMGVQGCHTMAFKIFCAHRPSFTILTRGGRVHALSQNARGRLTNSTSQLGWISVRFCAFMLIKTYFCICWAFLLSGAWQEASGTQNHRNLDIVKKSPELAFKAWKTYTCLTLLQF